MRDFNVIHATDAGLRALMEYSMSNEPIAFTRMVIGSGNPQDTPIKDMTGLISPEKEIPITIDKNNENPYVTITGILDYMEVNTPFKACELGLFLLDLKTGQEVMYCYAYSDNPVIITPNVRSSDTFRINTRIFATQDVNITDSGRMMYVLHETAEPFFKGFNELKEKSETFFNAFDDLKTSGSGGSGANLLINSDFRNPINQRGQSEIVSGVYGYLIDRWLVSTTGKATLTSTGITLESESEAMSLNQYIEFPERYEGLTMTLSANVDGTIYHTTDKFDMSGATSSMIHIGNTGYILNLTYNPDVLQRRFTARLLGTGRISNILWIKLEIGDRATPFMPRHFAEELALCQRYYEKSYNYSVVPGTAGSQQGLSFRWANRINQLSGVPFNTRKRIAPTVTIYAFDGTVNAVTRDNPEIVITNITNNTAGEHSIRTLAHVNSDSVFVKNEPYHYHWVADAEL